MEISKIKENPNNPRTISKAKFELLKKSITEFPEMLKLRPLVIDKDCIVLGGNMRLRALKALGYKDVPVMEAESLNDAQKREFVIKDNASFGEWDMDLLANEWSDLPLADWGIDIPVAEPEVSEDDFEIPETIKTDIKLGDMFQIGNHRLLCGDSTKKEDVERLMNGEKADMVFTDPPYGVDYDGGHATKKRREKLKGDDTVDLYSPISKMAFQYTIDDAPLYIWFAGTKGYAVAVAVMEAGYEIRCELIWNKNMAQFGAIGAQYKQKHEPCYYCFKKGHKTNWIGASNEVSVWDINRASKNEFHPTQKPVELAAKAISNHKAPHVIDFFLGSGTTMVACEQLNRKCYGIEISPEYCQVIIDRMKKAFPKIEIKKL